LERAVQKASVVSNRIWIKFGVVVLQVLVNTHRLPESGFDMTSYFQDGGLDVRPSVARCSSSVCRLAASPPCSCLQFL